MSKLTKLNAENRKIQIRRYLDNLGHCTYIHTFFSQCLPIVNMHLVRTVGVDIAIHIYIGCTCSTFLQDSRVKSGLASSLLSSTLSSMGLFHTVVVDLATSLWRN